MSTYITIPEEIKNTSLSDFSVHPKVINLFHFCNINTVGDFHLRTVEDILNVTHQRSPMFRKKLIDMIRYFGGSATEKKSELTQSAQTEDYTLEQVHASFDELTNGKPGRILLPHEVADIPISTFGLETRTFNFLTVNLGMSKYGDLHEFHLEKLYSSRGIGKLTLKNLADSLNNLISHPASFRSQSTDTGAVSLPAFCHDWPIATIPMSARTRSALTEAPLQAQTLGELQGARYDSLAMLPNFGKKSQEDLKELIKRIESGEFGTHSLSEGFPEVATVEGAVFFIETYIKTAFARLSAQDQSILEMRYGFGSHSTPHQLTAIADELGYSKERIRQIVENSIIPELQTGAGPKLGLALTTIRSHYVDNHLPFESDKKTTALVHFLDRSIPILIELPEKHNRGGIYNPTSVKDVLSRYFVGCGVNIEVRAAEACAYACQAAPKLTTFRFYHDVERLGFSFYKKAEQLCISKDKWTALEMVQIALEASSQPVHVDHLIEWAKAQPSFKNGEYRAENLLGLTGKPNETGVFLLDSKTIGLARHIRLAPALWDFVRIAFARFLKKNGAESTVYDFLKQERYTWFDQTNAFELSAILQLDPDKRFEKLSGKMKYTLANAA